MFTFIAFNLQHYLCELNTYQKRRHLQALGWARVITSEKLPSYRYGLVWFIRDDLELNDSLESLVMPIMQIRRRQPRHAAPCKAFSPRSDGRRSR